ncbi:cupin-like domain-containing protein [Massilia sp. PAMC28688]|uniref:cupin-like domain-containing protein n=1 Tax=Massilia sp. PAMC28688 TaxID=2861283 RepID=UPI001E4D896F|nr:cupin-like domain-containing protein [Massilia sp. PAMC28688]
MKQKTTFKTVTAVNDNWRSWIAENLLLGVHPDAIAGVLAQNGVPPLAARGEVEAALRSPYLRGVTRLANRVAKRDWVLGIQATLDRMGGSATPEVPRKDKLSGEDFFRQHYLTNRPVIITGMLDHFPALSKWNLDYFGERFGERMVEVQFGRDADPQYELNSIAHKRQIAFGEYVEMIRTSGSSNDFYMTANNDNQNRESLKELWEDVGTLPAYLADDPERRGFFWFGPAGTITPLHHDLTNNFMAQIVGRKRVRLIAPSELASVYNHRHCFTEVDARAPDLQRFPAMAGVPIHDCVLEPGEILFLPVGWWHHVEALDVSVTLAYTNFRWPNDFFSNYPSHHDF